MGCSKNLVDSELFMSQLNSNGFTVVHDSNDQDVDIVAINSCGFILDAKQESIETILDLIEAKRRGQLKKIFVFGCLSERYKDDLIKELPEVDKFYGKFEVVKMVEDLDAEYDLSNEFDRVLTTPSHYAYLKISEGCNRRCSYCAIPNITGKHISRTMESLVQEASNLARKGVKELLVIAQELTYYGIDIYKKQMIATLVNKLSEIEGIEWIKLHYAYPAGFPMDLIDVIKENPKVNCYLDIALQHVSDNMLSKMRRSTTKEHTYNLISRLREDVPNIHIRTTLLVGHPGETQDDFDQLIEFIKWAKFERLGVFPYSHEDDTFAGSEYSDDVPEEVKQQRAELVMELQRDISSSISEGKIGSKMDVIIDREENDLFIGRTEYDSPDVDGEVYIKSEYDLEIGGIYEVMITGSSDYDLYAEVQD